MIELRDELFEAGRVFQNILPVSFYTFEQPVSFIELTTLQLKHVLGFLPHQVPNDISRGRIVAAVHKLRLGHVLIPVYKIS